LEEVNGLGKNAITKARWVKPANRRREDQTVAHAPFLISAKDRNRCIAEDLMVCNTKVHL
jgi:hypothetical protein